MYRQKQISFLEIIIYLVHRYKTDIISNDKFVNVGLQITW